MGDGIPLQRLYYDDFQQGVFDGIGPPQDGEAWTYRCILDTDLGEWRFEIGESGPLETSVHPIWQEPGRFAQWVSEVHPHWEDDMTGTVSNPCILSELEARVGDGSFDLILDELGDTAHSDEPDLWHIERTGPSEIRIWDLDPHP